MSQPMLPLALNPAEGAALMLPLAVTVIGGLVMSTALTLFVVPALYISLTARAERLAAWATGRPAEGPSGEAAGAGGEGRTAPAYRAGAKRWVGGDAAPSGRMRSSCP